MQQGNISRIQKPDRVTMGLAMVAFLPPLIAYASSKSLSWDSVGEFFGMLGLICIVLSLVLMLRFPVLANAVGGLEAMYRLHRRFGLAGYLLLLLHPLAFAQAMGIKGLAPLGKSWGFLAGWAALLTLMLALLFTFVLRPAGYARWRNLHWLTATAFVLMVGHVLYYEQDWSRDAMLAGNAVMLIGLIAPLARYAIVDRGMAMTTYRVDVVNRPIPGVIDLKLIPDGEALAIKPGQFVFVRFMSGRDYTGCAHFHPFTASSVYPGGGLRLSIKANGRCTEAMQRLEPGAVARLQGPFGHLFENVRENVQIWIAGGIGITPFLARARMLEKAAGGKVKLFYLYDKGQAAFLDELQALAADNPNFDVYPLITHGLPGVATSVFDAMLPPWDDKSYILCGPPGLTENIRSYLACHGVAPSQIREEGFDFRQ